MSPRVAPLALLTALTLSCSAPDADGTKAPPDGDDPPETSTETPDPPTPDTSAPGDTATAPPEACSADTTCVEVPTGWNGPVSVSSAGGGCEGTWGALAFESHFGLLAEPATCDCACDAPFPEPTCPSTASLYQFDSNLADCSTQLIAAVETLSEGCNDIDLYDDASFHLNVPALDLTGTTCAPLETARVPSLAWEASWIGCGAALDTCDGGACVPELEADDAQLCVWAEGNVACPDAFTDRQLTFRGADDQRGCSECTCGGPAGECTATVTLRAGEGCSAGSPGSGPDDTCIAIETPARSAELAYDAPAVTCEPAAVAPEGTAVPADPVTVCCMP